MSVIWLNPIVVRTTGKRLKVDASIDRPFSKKGNKTTKVVDPNYDVLPVLFDLTGAYLEKKDVGVEVAQVEKNTLGAKAGLFGICRALMVLKVMNPYVYRLIIDLAKLLSYEIDEKVQTPPLALLLSFDNPIVEKVWTMVLDRTGVTKKDYAKEVAVSFEEKGILDVIALFSSKAKEDREEIALLLERPVTRLPQTRVYSVFKEDLSMILEQLKGEAKKWKA